MVSLNRILGGMEIRLPGLPRKSGGAISSKIRAVKFDISVVVLRIK
jgi:hypothetical protein